MTAPEKKSIWITGHGGITCAGATPAELWKTALAGGTGIVDGLGMIPAERIGPSGFGSRLLASELAGLAESKSVRLVLNAVEQAMADAGWTELRSDDALFIATTTGQVPFWESDYIDYLTGKLPGDKLGEKFHAEPLGISMDVLKVALDFPGRTQVISSACAASTQALGLAARWLRQGKARRCLVGGIETLSRLTVQGFRSLNLLSPQPATPFDEKRTGINLSEGAAFFCLELEPGEKPLAMISGSGFSNDAYHMTAPHPEGKGCLTSLRMALDDAGLAAGDLTWIHAHGTGSPQNDLAEAAAIRALGAQVPVSSTKGVHGHALAASGSVELLLCLQAIRHGTILGTRGLGTADPAAGILLPSEPRGTTIRHILKTTSGFGGTNAALVLTAPEVTS